MCDGRPERRLGELARLIDIECEEGPLGGLLLFGTLLFCIGRPILSLC